MDERVDAEVNVNDAQEQEYDFDADAQGFGTQHLFPYPGQRGVPYFDGKDVSRFLTNWEDLTIGCAKNIT